MFSEVGRRRTADDQLSFQSVQLDHDERGGDYMQRFVSATHKAKTLVYLRA